MEWYTKRTFGDLADEAAARFGAREALIFGNERYSFTELAHQIDRAAKGLMAQGVERGDHVALWLNNCSQWIFISFALAKIGAVQVPINTRFRTTDLDYVLRQSDATMLITHEQSGPIGYFAMTGDIVALPAREDTIADPNFPALRRLLILGSGHYGGGVSWEEALRSGQAVSDAQLSARAAEVDPDGPVLIMYTSGTTGFPKGVMHSHKLIRNVEERGFRMAITQNDVILNYLPLFHIFGYSEGALMSLLTGARQVLTGNFDPDACLDIVAREHITIMHGFEIHMKALCDAQEIRQRDIASLRTGIFAAGTHSATPILRRGARILAPLNSISGFGLTETWIGIGLGSLDDSEELRCESSGTVGLGYRVRIVDLESGADLAPGMAGELLVKGYSMMLGYYKKPDETAAAYNADGWFHTGDIAQWLDSGGFRFLGRHKDMLKVGGENVDPMEVEGLLLNHRAVHQVAVVGLPDERLSEIPVAFVQVAPNCAIDAEAVFEFCRGKVASFKIPRHVLFVDGFPMTASGKIRKVALRADAKNLLSG
jgi:fatty-acyl-CoA synthase